MSRSSKVDYEYLIRHRVLEILFPKSMNLRNLDENGQDTSIEGELEIFDRATNDPNGGVSETSMRSCAICLEAIEKNDEENGNIQLFHQIHQPPETVSGVSCEHLFHHGCLMKWIFQNHDGCPTCRQPLWDASTYSLIEEEIRFVEAIEPSVTKSAQEDQQHDLTEEMLDTPRYLVTVVPGSVDQLQAISLANLASIRFRESSTSPANTANRREAFHRCRELRKGGWRCFAIGLVLCGLLFGSFYILFV